MERNIKLPADLIWVNEMICRKGFWTKPHKHETYYHLQLAVAGSCRTIIHNQTYELTPNRIVLAAPNDIHSIPEVSAMGIRCIEMKFTVWSDSLNRALSRLPKVFEATALQKSLIEMIFQSECEPNGKVNVNAGRFSLITLLYSLCGETEDASGSECPSRYLEGIDLTGFSKATVDTVLFMEQYYMEEVTLEKISEAIGYHKNYISTMVMKDLGIHANEVLAFIRIQKAAELLRHSEQSMQDICLQTGFKNTSHFSRMFRKMVGVTPLQYRRSCPADILPTYDRNYDDNTAVWENERLRDYIDLKSR